MKIMVSFVHEDILRLIAFVSDGKCFVNGSLLHIIQNINTILHILMTYEGYYLIKVVFFRKLLDKFSQYVIKYILLNNINTMNNLI